VIASSSAYTPGTPLETFHGFAKAGKNFTATRAVTFAKSLTIFTYGKLAQAGMIKKTHHILQYRAAMPSVPAEVVKNTSIAAGAVSWVGLKELIV